MRRSKLGDVFYMKVPNGYKIYQWAYTIPQMGDFIRVFPGLYKEPPNNIDEIIQSKHSLILNFSASKAYKIGLSEFVGNYPVPSEYPFPNYMLQYAWVGIEVRVVDFETLAPLTDYVDEVSQLPEKYQDVTLLSGAVTPDWLMYLFDEQYDFSKLDIFFPGRVGKTLDKYVEIWKQREAFTKNRQKTKNGQ